jgi:uncharacterized membrane protein
MRILSKLSAACALITAALLVQGCVAYTVASTAVGTTAKVAGTAVGVTADVVGATSDAVFTSDEERAEKAARRERR